ncbi:MAG TPA: RDD family protein [Pyrinomonadaceae bacterium]|jgi:uncharacterized RDD family membrane protein YckC
MSARVERASAPTTPSIRTRTEEVIVNFDAARVKAPFLLRCGALLIDYIILVSLPVLGLLIARLSGDDGAKLFKSAFNSAGWLIAVLLAVTNFIIFPMLGGQSIGKMFTGLRIIRADGQAASFSQLLLRHLAGYPLTALTFGLGFLFSVFSAKGRALHDLVAGTVVVYGQKKPKVLENSK